MMGGARSAAARIRAVSRLRELCRRLPHFPTEAERRLLDRFQSLGRSPAAARLEDTDALAAGWRAWWRERRADDIDAMARSLPPGLVEADRRLATYALAARLARGAESR
jgi:hypothetical protein